MIEPYLSGLSLPDHGWPQYISKEATLKDLLVDVNHYRLNGLLQLLQSSSKQIATTIPDGPSPPAVRKSSATLKVYHSRTAHPLRQAHPYEHLGSEESRILGEVRRGQLDDSAFWIANEGWRDALSFEKKLAWINWNTKNGKGGNMIPIDCTKLTPCFAGLRQ